jgi:hypothetical protein
MRPNSSNRRSRGRGNRGNKNTHNPNRSYESNGPNNVKVRGNAQTIAEKYLSLSRDAQASGDTILAEGYLQFAEHYNRIVASHQQGQQNVRQDQSSQSFDDGDQDNDDREDGKHPLSGTVAQLHAPQPDMSKGESSDGEDRKSASSRGEDQQDERGSRRRYPRRITPRRNSYERDETDSSEGQEMHAPREEQATGASRETEAEAVQQDEAPKRKRGRPRKNPVEQTS